MVERMGKMNLDGLDNMAEVSFAFLSNSVTVKMKRNPKQMMQQLQGALDPGIVKQMGGMGNLMNMVKQFQEGGGGGAGMQDMMQNMMGGGGPGGGGGGMGNMMQMAQ